MGANAAVIIVLVGSTFALGLITGHALSSDRARDAKRIAKLRAVAFWASEVSTTKGPLDGGYVRYVSEETMSKMETQLKIAGYETGIITERIRR